MAILKNIKLAALLMLIVVGSFLIYSWANKSQNKYSYNLSSQTVIKQIESLNRLETASYTIEKIIDVKTTGGPLADFLYGDRILLIAHGQVIAGFDMSKLDKDQIEITEKTVKVTLPAPEILVNSIDNNQTRVYDRNQGLLTKGDTNLESEARKQAQAVIRDAACKGGILNEAEKNGRNQITALLRSLGFETVILEVPPGSCE